MIAKTNNTLMQQMLADVPGSQACFERIAVKPGPWPEQLAELTDCAFFPDDCLISLTPDLGASPQVSGVVLGHRSLWFSNGSNPSLLQARVIVGGYVYRVNWSLLRHDTQRYAPWFFLGAAASQCLISQMAQMAFCARHHALVPRLASWLLACMHQSIQPSMPISLNDIPEAFRVNNDGFEEAWAELQARQAIRSDTVLLPVSGKTNAPDMAWTMEPVPLTRLACTCHHHINAAASSTSQDVGR